MFKITKRKLVAGAIAAGVLITTGIGYAYWTSTGSGAGSASTGTAIAATLTGDPVSNLYPGKTPTAITGTVTVNNGASSAYIGTITPVIDGSTVFQDADGAGPIPACTAADYALTSAPHNAQIAAGTAGVAFGTIQLTDTTANQDSCKGQALVLAFSSN